MEGVDRFWQRDGVAFRKTRLSEHQPGVTLVTTLAKNSFVFRFISLYASTRHIKDDTE